MRSTNANRPGRTTRRRLLGAALGCSVAWPLPVRAAYSVKPWPAGRPVPTLALSDMADRPWSLAALAGRPVVLNFWATWCVPCRAEMPSLDALARREAPSGLRVLAINYREGAAAIRRFLEMTPVALPVLLDRDGNAASAWTSSVFPSTVLIDRSGMPRLTVIGEIDWMGGAARELIEPLLVRRRAA